MTWDVVSPEPLPIIPLFSVTSEQHATDICQGQVRRYGFQRSAGYLLQVSSTVRSHAIPELGQALPDIQNGRLSG